MNRRGLILRLVLAAVLAGLTLAGLTLAPASADGKRVALVIGNSAYRNVPELPNPANDASDVAAALRRLGFAVTLMTNATFDQMRRGLIGFGRDAAGADMAALYFAGHGMEIGGENWLIPIDAELTKDSDAENEAISLRSVMLQVSSTTSLGLVMLDACRNNPFAAKMRRSLALRAVVGGGLGRIEPLGNVLVAYAARDGTTALDGDGRNSPFTAALLHNIEMPGVEVTFMFRNVRDDVMEVTKNEQQPFVYGSLSRKAIYLAGQPSSADQSGSQQANAAPAAAGPPLAAAPAAASAIDPALVGTWEIMVPSSRGLSRWIWRIMGDGTYQFHAEGGRAAPSHEGTITAASGRWTLHAMRGLKNYADSGSYEVRDTTAVITGKLGTGYWKRSLQ